MASVKTSVLFVCLGNICRSPTAEGVFRHLVKEQGMQDTFIIESCGTGAWHVGNPPHPETFAVAKKNGVSLEGQVARRIERDDFSRFDYIIAMDSSNLADIRALSRKTNARIHLMREWDLEADRNDIDVPDPYLGEDGFQEVFSIVDRSCREFLKHLLEERD